MAWKVPAQGSAAESVLANEPPSVPRSAPRCRPLGSPRRLPADALDPPRHLDGGAARERHQEDAAGIGAVGDEMHDAMRERRRLARARAGDDEEG